VLNFTWLMDLDHVCVIVRVPFIPDGGNGRFRVVRFCAIQASFGAGPLIESQPTIQGEGGSMAVSNAV
jgi:hypothetical protein